MAYQLFFDGIDILEQFSLKCESVDFGTALRDIPTPLKVTGRSGTIKLADLFGISYNDRTFSAYLKLQNRYKDFELFKSEFYKTWQGKKTKISDNYNQNRYILGELQINSEKTSFGVTEISITALCDPWWYDANETILDYNNSVETVYEIINKKQTVIPLFFTSSANMEIGFEGIRYSIPQNFENFEILNISFKEGINNLTIYTVGDLKVKFRQGEL